MEPLKRVNVENEYQSFIVGIFSKYTMWIDIKSCKTTKVLLHLFIQSSRVVLAYDRTKHCMKHVTLLFSIFSSTGYNQANYHVKSGRRFEVPVIFWIHCFRSKPFISEVYTDHKLVLIMCIGAIDAKYFWRIRIKSVNFYLNAQNLMTFNTREWFLRCNVNMSHYDSPCYITLNKMLSKLTQKKTINTYSIPLLF